MSGPVSKVRDVRVAGPLAPFVDGFRARLHESGYTALTAVNELQLVANLSRWLDAGGWTAADLTPVRVIEFCEARRAAGYVSSLTPRSFTPLVRFLTDLGVLVDVARVVSASAVEILLDSFHGFLLSERGLAGCTAIAYVARARRFLGWCASDGKLDRLVAADVTAAVAREATTVSVGSTQFFVAGLRSFLRFCHIQGWIGADLSAAALAVTGRRSSFLPKGISRRDAEALLGSCDRREPIGRRDYAVLIILMRLHRHALEQHDPLAGSGGHPRPLLGSRQHALGELPHRHPLPPAHPRRVGSHYSRTGRLSDVRMRWQLSSPRNEEVGRP